MNLESTLTWPLSCPKDGVHLSAAGLRVLADVAARTQIVLFTHHRHVRASAEMMNSPSEVIVHEF